MTNNMTYKGNVNASRRLVYVERYVGVIKTSYNLFFLALLTRNVIGVSARCIIIQL